MADPAGAGADVCSDRHVLMGIGFVLWALSRAVSLFFPLDVLSRDSHVKLRLTETERDREIILQRYRSSLTPSMEAPSLVHPCARHCPVPLVRDRLRRVQLTLEELEHDRALRAQRCRGSEG